ncbi:hypothetical protein F511_17874 [Dorcoceras hygrometricum]|uniref:Lysine ketoglutarate reductase trans-splicing protein n=1 Tax=Dorcoceras hygrometricum TaxID=472368 RepID=A0A2Z7CIC0_9LAMI|nr:hypothetical protein F511_17874 [Dorcoceras hygrometricum]
MRLIFTTFLGIIIGFFLAMAFPALSFTKAHFLSTIFPSTDIAYDEGKYFDLQTLAPSNLCSSLERQKGEEINNTKIWEATNPRGAERLPPGVIAAESDFYMRRLYGVPGEDLIIKPRYLMTFTVGLDQKMNIDAAVKKLTENFTILLFHYDGRTSEWDEFEWSKTAIHVSVRKQTKWWYAKRFLHPDIVAPYDYIFLWDEDLGVENLDFEEYIKLVKKHGLEISQPALSPDSPMTWEVTRKRNDSEVHRETKEMPEWCRDRHLPPCTAYAVELTISIMTLYIVQLTKKGLSSLFPLCRFIEIMAPVFSREAWQCVWHMIQNDLVHGWGLDFALKRCVDEPAHEKIGVVDSQWIVHQAIPSLRNQGEAENGKTAWERVRERCMNESTMFQERLSAAEKAQPEKKGIDPPNSTAR